MTLSNNNALFLNKLGEPLATIVAYLMLNELCQLAGVEKTGLSVSYLRHTELTLTLQERADPIVF